MTRAILFGIFVMAVAPLAALGQSQTTGPITPPPTFELKKIPAKPEPAPPPMPADQIIQRFTQNEDMNKKAFDADIMDQSVKVEERVTTGGLFELSGEQFTKPDGEHYETVLKPPTSNLHYTEFSLEDVKFLNGLRLFFLTTDQLPQYNLSYEGVEKLDQINAYIFRVQPKQLVSKPLFEGVIWVDDHDFSIVKSYGHFVTDTGDFARTFPFQMFEIYRENIEGHVWLPTYIRSDSEVKTPDGTVPIRLVIRSSNLRPNAPASTPPAAKPSGPGKTL